MNKDTIIHSVFETLNDRRECVGAFENEIDAQLCVDRRRLCTGGTYDVQLFKLGEESDGR